MDIKTLVAIIGIIGVPSIWTICITMGRSIKKVTRDVEILQSAQKAQMRSQLLHLYYDYKGVVNKGGKIADDDIQDWINQYEAYHELVGANGVLDHRKDELLNFPTYLRN